MRAFLVVVSCMTCLTFRGQDASKDLFYLYNSNWKPCKQDSARYFTHVQKLDDSTWRWEYYNFSGPLLTIETYKDENGTIPNGYFAYFNKKGKIDSGGYTSNGLKNGTWYYYGDSTRPQKIQDYEMGHLVKEKLADAPSANNLLKSGEKEANFAGGEKAWKKYLETNLKTPDRAIDLCANGMVLVSFVVNVTGHIGDVSLIKSVEYSADQEAMRIIKNAPLWEPAIQDGHPVKAYRIQPITFRVD